MRQAFRACNFGPQYQLPKALTASATAFVHDFPTAQLGTLCGEPWLPFSASTLGEKGLGDEVAGFWICVFSSIEQKLQYYSKFGLTVLLAICTFGHAVPCPLIPRPLLP